MLETIFIILVTIYITCFCIKESIINTSFILELPRQIFNFIKTKISNNKNKKK